MIPFGNIKLPLRVRLKRFFYLIDKRRRALVCKVKGHKLGEWCEITPLPWQIKASERSGERIPKKLATCERCQEGVQEF